MTKTQKKVIDSEYAEVAGVGHNSEVSGARLTAFASRIEKFEQEAKDAGADARDVYKEAKSAGFDPKIIKKILKLKKINKEKLREEQELTALYAAAMQLDLGL